MRHVLVDRHRVEAAMSRSMTRLGRLPVHVQLHVLGLGRVVGKTLAQDSLLRWSMLGPALLVLSLFTIVVTS